MKSLITLFSLILLFISSSPIFSNEELVLKNEELQVSLSQCIGEIIYRDKVTINPSFILRIGDTTLAELGEYYWVEHFGAYSKNGTLYYRDSDKWVSKTYRRPETKIEQHSFNKDQLLFYSEKSDIESLPFPLYFLSDENLDKISFFVEYLGKERVFKINFKKITLDEAIVVYDEIVKIMKYKRHTL
jgi:hypothetical protein